jgi:hypothetical protein
MKKRLLVILSCLFIFISLLQGCGLPNQPYVKKDNPEIPPIKVVRYDTPSFRTYKSGNMIGAIVAPGILFGVIGAGIGYAIHRSSSEEPADPTRPDFGKLVMDTFIERAKIEILSWPNMTVQEKTIKEPLIDKTCYVLEMQVEDIKVEIDSSVLMINTIITMKDRENNIVWQKGYNYDSVYFQRVNTVEALKADNYKLLKDEYAFAADKTVSDFIMHFKNSLLYPPKT